MPAGQLLSERRKSSLAVRVRVSSRAYTKSARQKPGADGDELLELLFSSLLRDNTALETRWEQRDGTVGGPRGQLSELLVALAGV